MLAALRVFFRSLGDTWFNLIGYATCNLLVAAGFIFVPLALGALLGAIGAPAALLSPIGLLVSFLLGAPLMLGLIKTALEAVPYSERPETGSVLRYARELAWQAWKLGFALLAGSLVILIALYFYLNVTALWALPLLAITAAVAVAWFGTVLYSGPLLLRSTGGTRTALRNGMVASLHYPVFNVVLVLLSSLVLVLSILAFPLMALVTLSFFAVLAAHSTNWILEKEGLLSRPEDGTEIIEEL